MKPIVVLGDANVDLAVALPDRASRPVDLSRSVPRLTGGGTGANTAWALARLGLPVEFIGAVGDDGYGRWIIEDFHQGAVGTRGIKRLPDAFTPIVLALIEPDGERFLVVWPPQGGAHTLLRPDDLDQDLIRSAAWLHTTGMCLRASPVREAVLRGMRLAREAGVTVSLDLNLRIELWGYDDDIRETVAQAIALADIVFGSARDEIMPVAGGSGTLETALRLLSGGTKTIVARAGAEGVTMSAGTATTSLPAFSAPVVNLVGAGDAFDAGFIAGWLNGTGVEGALRWGNAVAALKIQRAGSRDLPDLRDVQTLLVQASLR
jgi:sugar/nucleoside kinase (ribokinase family)